MACLSGNIFLVEQIGEYYLGDAVSIMLAFSANNRDFDFDFFD